MHFSFTFLGFIFYFFFFFFLLKCDIISFSLLLLVEVAKLGPPQLSMDIWWSTYLIWHRLFTPDALPDAFHNPPHLSRIGTSDYECTSFCIPSGWREQPGFQFPEVTSTCGQEEVEIKRPTLWSVDDMLYQLQLPPKCDAISVTHLFTSGFVLITS